MAVRSYPVLPAYSSRGIARSPHSSHSSAYREKGTHDYDTL